MARDKLITIRIEGDKRQAFGDLAKSQNTDTASLLYDFISQCLDGRIDISLVTGKGNRLDKLDNRIDSERIDRLEATTQEIDKRLGNLSKKVTDWVVSFDDCLNDCDRELSEKINNLEHRLNTLSSQLDSQRIDSEIDSIDTDRQGETPDMGTVATVETVETVEAVDKVETMEPDSIDESVTGSIGPVPGEGDSVEPGKGEGMNAAEAYRYLTAKGVKVSEKTLSNWISKNKEIPTTDKGDEVSEYLVLRGKLYYPNPD